VPAAALLVLACLLAPSPEVPAAPPAGGTTAAAPEPAPAPTSPSQPAPSAEATPSPAPVVSETVDPWADVPVQTAVPVAPAPAPFTARTATHAPLLDPWAGGPHRGVPRKLDPELRDPFRDLRMHPPAPRLAQADLRDPFARSPAAVPVAPPPAVARPESPAPSVPQHPDLRDPFAGRKGRPAPPPAAAPAGPVAPPPAPPAPTSTTTPGRERSGALPVTTRPFAHLFGAPRST
jgi:hypothetical protein